MDPLRKLSTAQHALLGMDYSTIPARTPCDGEIISCFDHAVCCLPPMGRVRAASRSQCAVQRCPSHHGPLPGPQERNWPRSSRLGPPPV